MVHKRMSVGYVNRLALPLHHVLKRRASDSIASKGHASVAEPNKQKMSDRLMSTWHFAIQFAWGFEPEELGVMCDAKFNRCIYLYSFKEGSSNEFVIFCNASWSAQTHVETKRNRGCSGAYFVCGVQKMFVFWIVVLWFVQGLLNGCFWQHSFQRTRKCSGTK